MISKKSFIGAMALSVVASCVLLSAYRLATPASPEYGSDVFVGTITDKNGIEVGSIHVKYLNKTIFTSLLVTKSENGVNQVLYRIDKNGFHNAAGEDGSITDDLFYGYEFAQIRPDSFTLHLLTNNGHNVSDDVTIVWNSTKHLFEIVRPNFDDAFTLAGELTTPEGTSLGKVFVVYDNNKDPNSIASLYIVTKVKGKAQVIYRIDDNGFFNIYDKQSEIPVEAYSKIKLLSIKGDQAILELIDTSGNVISDELVIQWNSNSQTFSLKR